jgi:hypothetical protein
LAGLALAAGLSLALAAPAGAATTKIGSVGFIEGGIQPDDTPGGNVFHLDSTLANEFVPAGYGVITAWAHYTGDTGGDLTFKVYRYTGNPGEVLLLDEDPRTVVADTPHVFPVQIPVQPGDMIGVSNEGVVNVAYPTGNGSDGVGIVDGDPEPGETAEADGIQGYVAAVMAIVETDNDGDGAGDDTQDADDDNDGVADSADAFPLNAGEKVDSDLDSQGDNADLNDDNDGVTDANEAKLGTNPLDVDSDDDGLSDGAEDKNGNGVKGKRETNPARRDTDRDKLTDGVERGVRKPIADPAGAIVGTDTSRFRRDAQPKTRTNPLRADSDKDGLKDGKEDKDRDGRRDAGETSPKSKDSDKDGTRDKKDDFPLNRRRD